MNKPGTSRVLASALGLETAVDKILFGTSIIIIAILIVAIYFFWRRRNQVRPHRSTDDALDETEMEKKIAKSTIYPTITFSQKKSRTDSTSSIESGVSSMWDSQSQRFDNIYFKDTELRSEIDKCLSASRDIESGDSEDESATDVPSSCTSEFGSVVEDEDEQILPEYRISFERQDETIPATDIQKIQMKVIISKSEDFDGFIESRDDYCEAERRGSI
jgi:hypothetical protein